LRIADFGFRIDFGLAQNRRFRQEIQSRSPRERREITVAGQELAWRAFWSRADGTSTVIFCTVSMRRRRSRDS
jgi:hypothetical protein